MLLCTTGAARALGFGPDINASYLGQPLDFAAVVRLQPDEFLPRECASAEVMAGDSRLPTEAVVVTVEPGRVPGERMVRVTTRVPIAEPIVTVSVTAGCQPRLTRSFVSLMDPPGLNLAQADAPPPALPPQRLDSQVSPAVAVAEAAAAGAAPAPAAPRADRSAPPRPRVAPPARRPRAERSPPRERRVAAARPARPREGGGSRLQLEPATVLAAAATASAPPAAERAPAAPAAAASATDTAAAVAAAAAASGVISVGAAASAAEAPDAAAARRVAQLEASLAQLREESLATQRALVALQASLKEAQDARYANPVVYALAWVAALLALMVAALWWRQSQARTGTQWWLAPANAGGAAPVRPAVPRGPLLEPGAARVETAPAVMDERPVMRTLDELPAARRVAPPPVPAAAPVMLADPPVLRRELSVEELIDLEQQADFFVVLGQDEAAIDLLMGHVRSSGGVSPLPYLKLLEIYRRRGDREAYERIRERFNRRFSAYAPEWDADLAQGRSIDDYPKMLIQLQRLWDEPTRVTQMLDAALMRQDGSGDTYDLPAYRELLFLYSIARDLAEHPVAPGDIDLLLPLDGEVQERPIEKLTASRLMGFASTEQHEPTVDLDITMPIRGARPAPPSDFLGLVDPKLKDGGSEGR